MFCPHCGKEISEGQEFCHHCGARLVAEPVQAATETAGGGGRQKTPWEDRETSGFFGGLFKNLNEALFRPSEFFKKMAVTGGLTDPLLYALIIGMVGMMFSYFWQIMLKNAMQDMMPWMQAAAGQNMYHGVGVALLSFFSPFLIILTLFISSGILHVFLMIVKGARNGFEATFRVVAYGYSANILLVLPFCGGILYLVWTLVLLLIGLREAHETTGGKAALAVFLPFVVCLGLTMIVLGLLLGSVIGTMMQMQK